MRITTTKKFDKQFRKQSGKVQKEFTERIKLLLVDLNHPLLRVHPLQGKLKGLYSLNISGDIRVIFDRSFADVIILEAIGSHSELYE
jgi:addiction module RelE/StbE family toxin